MRAWGVLSDTHAEELGLMRIDRLAAIFNGVERILHAGDIVSETVLDELEQIAPVTAVRGNMDLSGAVTALPFRRVLSFDKYRVGLIHGWGPAAGIRDRIIEEFRDDRPDLVVYGHTHAACSLLESGCRWFNPGSAALPRHGQLPSVGLIRLRGGDLSGEIVPL